MSLEGDLTALPIEEIRSLRADYVTVETGVSYQRRLVQGAVDIVNQELARRAEGGDPVDAAGLVERLPEILGEVPRPPGVGRLPRTLEPVELDPGFSQAYEELAGGGRLAQLGELGAVELAELLDALRTLESRISARRTELFGHIDALQTELTRRYRCGEASVDALLTDPT
ncbi:MAG: hypothetical protein MUF83_07820 [Acidimicrobiales bacterium]|jgi:hypothetical protein|nr:hypothetical protein [Acidimicrobiales bacterium]